MAGFVSVCECGSEGRTGEVIHFYFSPWACVGIDTIRRMFSLESLVSVSGMITLIFRLHLCNDFVLHSFAEGIEVDEGEDLNPSFWSKSDQNE